MRGRARSQRPLDRLQLLGAESRLSASSPRRLQASSAVRRPRLMPMIGGGGRHLQGPRHRRLRLAAREQPRGLEPPSFQRSKILSGSAAGGWHASA